MINKKRTFLDNEREHTNRSMRRLNIKLTPIQKLQQIRKMYMDLKTHLVDGAQDSGVAMDIKEFEPLMENNPNLQGIDSRYRRMITIYEGVKHDVQVYVQERYAERAEAARALDKILK